MRARISLGALALSLVLAASARAAAPAVVDSPSLYSHTMALQFQGSGGLVQLRLPKEVYLQAHSRTLDDLRLFDAHGRAVAFALTMPLQQRSASPRATPVKVFALDGEADTAGARFAIRTAPDGSLLSVESRAAGSDSGALLAGLLLDLGPTTPQQAPVTALVFTAPPDAASYSARVGLEDSDDLQSWSTLSEAQLDWLSNGASDTLANNRIAFDVHPRRYLRLRWRQGKPRLFGAVGAEREPAATLAYAADTLLLAPQAGAFPGDLVYPVGPALPLRSIGLQLTEPGLVVPSDIGRYTELAPGKGSRRWQFTPLLRTTFYRIAQPDGSVRTPPDLLIAPLSVERLVLRPATPLAGAPQLRIGWLPATMIFAAREAGPYTLAMGRDQAPAVQAALSDVAPGYQQAELLAIAAAVAGPVTVQRGSAPAPSTAQRAGLSATARTAVLWGVLLLGVLVLAVLCWRMVKQWQDPRNS